MLVPGNRPRAWEEPMTWDMQDLCKSSRDVWLSGVCGGLGEHTPLPSWLWRTIFVATTIGIGVGFVAYIALWIFMPRRRPPMPTRTGSCATKPGSAAAPAEPPT